MTRSNPPAWLRVEAERGAQSTHPGLAKVGPRLLPTAQPVPGMNVQQRKLAFEQLLVAAGFAPNERNGYEIARRLGFDPNTLRGWRNPRDLARHPSDAAFERVERYIEMQRLLAEFGRAG
jgi:hypothetical protein